MSIETLSSVRSFAGWHRQYSHQSETLGCAMRFAVYLPPQVEEGEKVPVLYWLSGLTCTDENFMQKAGAHRMAAELGVAIVAPDTSPRGEDVPDDSEGAYDFGLGAGFYVNATQAPWDKHYRMYDYVVNELPALIEAEFPVSDKKAISGHSMGGHGALMISLRNPGMFVSASAFSPITNPVNAPWGQKAFSNYLGDDVETWRQYDTCELINLADSIPPMLVDQGGDDSFLHEQLMPENLVGAVASSGLNFELRMQPGYDHSYYFIASFIEEHLRFHAGHLKG
ncbi:S-formylglutathione hydrolase [Aliamphritea ceti]|uniref:S-formylglutathione hydrolase n=1 Tax=Aliamphritea ceti TaxID=1524258 RepID=UPI0021C367BF